MMSELETGPQYPGEEGSKISGDPALEVDGQGLFSGPTTGPSNTVVSKQATVMDCATAFKLKSAKMLKRQMKKKQRKIILEASVKRFTGTNNINRTDKNNQTKSLESDKVEPMRVENYNEVQPKNGINDDSVATVSTIVEANKPTRSYYSSNWYSYLHNKTLSHFIEPPPNSEAGPVYENKVDGNLKVYIVDQSQPDGKILEQNRPILELALTKSIDETLDQGYLTPKFFWFAYSKEKFYISCQNLESLNFLKTAVKKFGELWPDAQLQLIDNTRTIEATVWIPGQIEDPETLIRRIGRQNSLNVMKWQLLDVESKPGFGQILIVAIDDESADRLRGTCGMVSCGLTTVTMKMKFLNGDNVEFDDSK